MQLPPGALPEREVDHLLLFARDDEFVVVNHACELCAELLHDAVELVEVLRLQFDLVVAAADRAVDVEDVRVLEAELVEGFQLIGREEVDVALVVAVAEEADVDECAVALEDADGFEFFHPVLHDLGACVAVPCQVEEGCAAIAREQLQQPHIELVDGGAFCRGTDDRAGCGVHLLGEVALRVLADVCVDDDRLPADVLAVFRHDAVPVAVEVEQVLHGHRVADVPDAFQRDEPPDLVVLVEVLLEFGLLFWRELAELEVDADALVAESRVVDDGDVSLEDAELFEPFDAVVDELFRFPYPAPYLCGRLAGIAVQRVEYLPVVGVETDTIHHFSL